MPPSAAAASGARPGVRDRLRLEDAEFEICTRALKDLGARFTQTAPILDPDPDCGILRPVTLSRPVPGVALDPPAPLRCDAALALSRWIRGTVIPAATRLPEGKAGLSAIEHATSYTCRRRNNAATGKLSEHAFGNAIDIFAFRFGATETLPVKPRAGDGNLRESFQRAVRAGACLEFTTVLGPGTDAAHARHLHLDVRQRRGGFRLCQ
ncbi:extensin-like domain-containing protein [Brevirhabdus sp.]|uniref:extensin-like domain-containing protein n=1 Tax=Brevirhabdus sp. TaxID=2004514 RepID=UPI00405A28C2